MVEVSTDKVVSHIEALVEPILISEGMALVDVEFRRERHGRILRIIVDKQGGVTLDDCAQISGQLGDLLDVKLTVNGPYSLEVSSPGLDRPLTKLKHFNYFKGRKAVVWTRTHVDGKTEFRGELGGVSEEKVLVALEENTVRIPFDDISKARLDF